MKMKYRNTNTCVQPWSLPHVRYANLKSLRRKFVDEVALRMLCHVCHALDLPWPVGHLTQLPDPALYAIFMALNSRSEVEALLKTCTVTARFCHDEILWKALVKK